MGELIKVNFGGGIIPLDKNPHLRRNEKEESFEERMDRIRRSLESINFLMEQLKERDNNND